MSPNEQKIYAVIYDRFIQKRFYTTLAELADETRINKTSLNTYLCRMNKKYFDLHRSGKTIRINDVQRISDGKFD
jgi:hypothetical protein